jgi:hypothetical protein
MYLNTESTGLFRGSDGVAVIMAEWVAASRLGDGHF